jgi:predicted nucleotide-binding protein (sugar kinase/HSP70/actin superfamily)
MEVGKLILNVVKSKATMTLSVKPFGCMPSSSVSDGVQSLITERISGGSVHAFFDEARAFVRFFTWSPASRAV